MFQKEYWIFSEIFFSFESTTFMVINGKLFHSNAASAEHALAYTIDPIFKHIIDCVYFTNGLKDIVVKSVICRRNTCLWRLPTNTSPKVSNWNNYMYDTRINHH